MKSPIFRNLYIFEAHNTEHLLSDLVNDALVEHMENDSMKHARLPASNELAAIGWGTVFSDSEGDYFTADDGGAIHMVFQRSERMLPGHVVREALQDRIRHIEERDLRKVYARERASLKEDVIAALLPQAFIRTKLTRLMIFPKYLVIETASPTQAETVASFLRDMTGSLPIRPWVPSNLNPTNVLTDWIKNQDADAMAPLSIPSTGKFKLKDQDSGGSVTINMEDISDEGFPELLAAGRVVERASLMCPRSDYRFELQDNMAIRSFDFDDYETDLSDQTGDMDEIEDAEERKLVLGRAARFLAAENVKMLIADLTEAMGGAGESDPEDLL